MNYGGTLPQHARDTSPAKPAPRIWTSSTISSSTRRSGSRTSATSAPMQTRPAATASRSCTRRNITPAYWGHLGLLHLSDHVLTPGFSAYQHTALASPYPHNGVVADLAHAQGALVGYVHPFDTLIDPGQGAIAHQRASGRRRPRQGRLHRDRRLLRPQIDRRHLVPPAQSRLSLARGRRHRRDGQLRRRCAVRSE